MTRAFHALVVLALCVFSTQAEAFHTGKTFADAPGAGGGGGLYYVGSSRERGWTCTSCHHDAPGRLRVRFTSSLFRNFEYSPGETSELTIQIEGEERGLSSGLSNFNGMVLSVLDDEGRPAGTFTNATPDQYEIRSTSRGDLAIASAGQDTGVVQWRFSWIAPPADTGRVTLYLGVVDGNGADSPANVTLTDPFGDDVYMAKVVLEEVGAAASVSVVAPMGTPVHSGQRHPRPWLWGREARWRRRGWLSRARRRCYVADL